MSNVTGWLEIINVYNKDARIIRNNRPRWLLAVRTPEGTLHVHYGGHVEITKNYSRIQFEWLKANETPRWG